MVGICVLLACGAADDESASDAGPGGSTGMGEDSTGGDSTDSGDSSDSGGGPGDSSESSDGGSDDTGSPMCEGEMCEPCEEGEIAAACACGGTAVDLGYCCSDVWFEPAYETLTGGCPADPFFYVDPDHGSASDDNPGTAEAPWATLRHAVDTLTAGQTVIVAGATYTGQPVDLRFEPVFNPANSGAPGAPIVIKGVNAPIVTTVPTLTASVASATADTVTFDESVSTESGAYEGFFVRITDGNAVDEYRRIAAYDGPSRTATVQRPWEAVPEASASLSLTTPGPLIGTNGRQHVVWDGFHVIERDSYHPDTGPVVGWASQDVAFLGNEIEGQTVTLIDNHNGLRIEGSERIWVRNNEIHGQQPIDIGANNPQNHASVMIYTSSDCVFEHNEVHDTYSAFFPKGGDSGHVFRFNEVHDAAKAFRVSYHASVDIHQNVIYACEIGLQPAEENADVRFFNNVVYDCATGVNNWFPTEGFSVFNNLFVQTPAPFHFEAAPGNLDVDYNGYFGMEDFVVNNDNVGGLSGWQGLGYDANAVEADPQFVDAASLDFRLEPGSPVEAAGADSADLDGDGDTTEAIPLGAYVGDDVTIGRFGPR